MKKQELKIVMFKHVYIGIVTVVLVMLSFVSEAKSDNALSLFKHAKILQHTSLTKSSHTSDGSDRAKNGKPRFVGSLGADTITYKGYQYGVFYSAKDRGGYGDFFAEVMIARRKIGTSNWEYSTLPVYRVTSNDAHNRVSIAISEGDGTIHIAFDHHNTPRINYARTLPGVADKPESTIWNDQVFSFQRNMGFAKNAVERVTYPTFHTIPGGNLLMYFRSGGSTQGAMTFARYDAKQSKWTFVRKVSTAEGFFAKNVTGNKAPSFRGPYTTGGPKIDENGRIHISWLFREKPVNCNPGGTNGGRDCNHGLYYAYSDDQGVTWFNSSGKLIADTSQGQFMSVETQGLEVADIPTLLKPSNVSLNAILDPVTGNYHVLIEHKTSPTDDTLLHRYVRDRKGKWTVELFDFSAASVKMKILGDQMFAFAGRTEAKVYYANRKTGFTDWQQVIIPKSPDTQNTIEKGYINWDLSLLDSGRVSLTWHQEPKNKTYGKGAPIYTYDFSIGEIH